MQYGNIIRDGRTLAQYNPVAAFLFGAIKCAVRLCDEFFRFEPFFWNRAGNAETGSDFCRYLIKFDDDFTDAFAQPFGNPAGGFGLCIRQHQNEFFAAVATHHIAGAIDPLLEQAGYNDQAAIPHQMAILIVQLLEMIDIEQNQ